MPPDPTPSALVLFAGVTATGVEVLPIIQDGETIRLTIDQVLARPVAFAHGSMAANAVGTAVGTGTWNAAQGALTVAAGNGFDADATATRITYTGTTPARVTVLAWIDASGTAADEVDLAWVQGTATETAVPHRVVIPTGGDAVNVPVAGYFALTEDDTVTLYIVNNTSADTVTAVAANVLVSPIGTGLS